MGTAYVKGTWIADNLSRVLQVETESNCWVCSLPLAKGERVTRLASLGFEVHARCAETLLRDEPPPEPDDPHSRDDRSPDPSD
jgi:hypothetical protein